MDIASPQPTRSAEADVLATNAPSATPEATPAPTPEPSKILIDAITESFPRAEGIFYEAKYASFYDMISRGLTPDAAELESAKRRGLEPEGVMTLELPLSAEEPALSYKELFIYSPSYIRYQVRYPLNGLTPDEAIRVFKAAERYFDENERFTGVTGRSWHGADAEFITVDAFDESIIRELYMGNGRYTFNASRIMLELPSADFITALVQYDGENYLIFQLYVPIVIVAAPEISRPTAAPTPTPAPRTSAPKSTGLGGTSWRAKVGEVDSGFGIYADLIFYENGTYLEVVYVYYANEDGYSYESVIEGTYTLSGDVLRLKGTIRGADGGILQSPAPYDEEYVLTFLDDGSGFMRSYAGDYRGLEFTAARPRFDWADDLN